MDELFTVDNMRNEEILDTTCEHLPLEDLLVFEGLTSVTRSAVAAHKFQQLVRLGPGPKIADLTARLMDSDSGERLRGPIITRPAIEVTFKREDFQNTLRTDDGSSEIPKLWHWMLSAIVLRSTHLTELKFHLYQDDYDSSYFTRDHFKAMNLHAESLLTGINFGQCTRLTIDFNIMPENHNLLLMPEFLKHFPALEELVLRGGRLPRISFLPAPHKHKKLELTFEDYKNQLHIEPAVRNFSGLEQFSFLSFGAISGYDLMKPKTFPAVCRLTGVDWIKSFKRHPPRNLQQIALPCLVDCTLSLLVNCLAKSASSCRSLTLDSLALDDRSPLLAGAAALQSGCPVGRFLGNLTHLRILCSALTRDHHVNEFIHFTPSLTCLELNIVHRADWGDKPFNADHPLRQLTILTLVGSHGDKRRTYSTTVTRDWVRTVRQNASPEGLQVVVAFRKGSELEKVVFDEA